MRIPACLIVPTLVMGAVPGVCPGQSVIDSHVSQGLTSFSPGQRVASIGDMDGDGLRDLAIGQRTGSSVPNSSGEVHIIGSATRDVIQAYGGPSPDRWIGEVVHGLPDLDGDGLPEVASGPVFSCHLIVFWSSGGAPTTVLAPNGCGSSTQFARNVIAVTDEDQDGVRDLAVGCSNCSVSNGAVFVVSSATGTALREVAGSTQERFGTALQDAGDQNADGITDWFVGAPGTGTTASTVVVVDGLTGDRIATHTPPADKAFGGNIAVVPDQDGDGLLDYVSPMIGSGFGDSAVLTMSSTGALLSTANSPPGALGFGATVRWAGDVDGDGRGEVAVVDTLLTSLPSQIWLLHPGESAPHRVLLGDGMDALVGVQLATDLDWDGNGMADVVVGDLDGPGILEANVRFDVITVCFGSHAPVCNGTVHGLGAMAELSTCAVIDDGRWLQFALRELPGDATAMLWMGPGSAAGAIQPSGLCLGGSPQRVPLVGGSDVFSANPDGTAHVRMSLGSQGAFPSASWMAGSSWAFQAIYLDTTGGASTLGWSNAHELMLP